jgi:hypothetical protein
LSNVRPQSVFYRVCHVAPQKIFDQLHQDEGQDEEVVKHVPLWNFVWGVLLIVQQQAQHPETKQETV